MTTMITELYDALKDAGAAEDKARSAAETVAAYENRFAKIESDLNVLKWMAGFNLGIVGLLLGSQTGLWIKLGEMSGQLSTIARAVTH